MASGNQASYGAIPGNEETEFDPRYLEEQPLTRKERLRKCITCGVPILVAAFIIGGCAWLLTHDFGRLYPSPGSGGGDPSYPNYAPIRHDYNPPPPGIVAPATAPKTKIETPAVAPAANGGKGGQCADYEKCQKLNLTGDCCPTGAGVMLECCN